MFAIRNQPMEKSDKYTTFEFPLVIREHYLDTFGHVNNAAYLEIFEEARWDIISQNGYGLDKIKESGKGPVILELHLLFTRELRLRAQVSVRTQLESYVGKVAVLKQWIVDEKGQTCCEAQFKVGLFDTLARKLILPTPEWIRALGAGPTT